VSEAANTVGPVDLERGLLGSGPVFTFCSEGAESKREGILRLLPANECLRSWTRV